MVREQARDLGRIGRDTDIAFGPFMVAGVLLTPWVAGLLGLVP